MSRYAQLLWYGLLWLLAPFAFAWGQIIFQTPLSPRIANYDIEARLNTTEKTIRASQTLTWHNATSSAVSQLQFHLYMNAFRSKNTTFMKEAAMRRRRIRRAKRHWGGIEILRFTSEQGDDLLPLMEYIQPDDENPHDSTVVRVLLPREIGPGESIRLEFDFKVRLPEIIARTGYADNFFLIGQWFPKIGVLQDGGNWNCHQFHANSEFFSDFGVYNVRIALPRNYVTGATGILVNREENDSLQTVNYRAEDVHDFAWTAWPDFERETREVQGVSVTLLYTPENRGQVERYFHSIHGALKYFGEWYMPYPYPELTIVDPPFFAMRSSGMEYPTFITGGSLWGIPEGLRLFPEEVAVHEFGHQYFYGILASNEFEEAWLDEGFNSYATARVMNQMYGQNRSMVDYLGLKADAIDMSRKDYIEDPKQDVVVKPAWEYKTGGYGRFSYDKPLLLLTTLENYLGEEVMARIMKSYVQRFKFKHPTTSDFINVVNELAPENMDWYFNQVVFDSKVLDYEVSRLSNSRREIPEDTTKAEFYESEAVLRRNGEVIFPQEVRFVFSNGDTVFSTWDGKDRYKIFNFEKSARLVSVQIDPQHKVVLDANWTNNGYTFQENRNAYLRHLFLSLNLYQTLLNLFTF